jgi:hypothetical protein
MTLESLPTTLATRLRIWWIETLKADSVRKWVPPYCTIWLTWALLALIVFPPVPSIYDQMGAPAYWAWVVIAVPANLAPMIGLRMRHGGSSIQDMSGKLLFRDWMGLILQATGHAVCHVLMVMFQIAAWMAVWNYSGPNSYAGLTIFAASMLLAWTGGTAILCAQCILKIKQGFQNERAL